MKSCEKRVFFQKLFQHISPEQNKTTCKNSWSIFQNYWNLNETAHSVRNCKWIDWLFVPSQNEGFNVLIEFPTFTTVYSNSKKSMSIKMENLIVLKLWIKLLMKKKKETVNFAVHIFWGIVIFLWKSIVSSGAGKPISFHYFLSKKNLIIRTYLWCQRSIWNDFQHTGS